MGCTQQALARFDFDEQYVRQLKDGSRPVEEHFSAYFHKVLTNYLRSRIKSPELLEDIRQETLLRVLHALRRGRGLHRPECLGAFVLAVCNNVLREFVRAQLRYSAMEEPAARPDAAPDPEAQAMARQMRTALSNALDQLAERDRQVLSMTLLEEQPHADISRRLGLKENHVRVVLHRAKAHLRDHLRQAPVIN